MILVHRIIPLISSLLLLACWESSLFMKESYMYFFSGIIIILFFALAQLFRWRIWSKQFFGFFVTPLLWSLGAFLFIVFVEDFWIWQFVIVTHVIGMGLLLESCFSYMHHTQGYQPYALENISGNINLLTLWLFFSGFFALHLFLSLPSWYLIFGVVVVTAACVLQTFWIYKIPIRTNKIFIFLLTILIVQFFWAQQYLPMSWLVNGLMLSIIYYIFMNIGKYHMLKSLNKTIVYRNLSLAFCVIILILATAQWT